MKEKWKLLKTTMLQLEKPEQDYIIFKAGNELKM